MRKCIVCGNVSNNTKDNYPVVLYHGFPKNEYMKRKWLKVFGINHCHDGQRICSDHFLKENYKSGRRRFLLYNAIPQPYNRNGFPSNYATQSNEVETGNNVILPMEQNIVREEYIANAAVNNFKSRGRSSRLTRNNENMSDHTLGSGVRCSVKNCFNRHSVNLSLFGYPKNFTLRKKWIEKCGLNKQPNEIIKHGTRVCSVHFELGCFKNAALKNRLKPGAVPSLFLDNMSINEVPVLSTYEDQFISPINNEAAEQSLAEIQNNVQAPDALPVSINEVPILSTCEDQFISPIENEAAEQLSEEIQNNFLDNTDNTSMIIDLTIDDSSNSSRIEDFTKDIHGLIFEMSKEVVLPSLYWKSEHLNAHNATRFIQRDANDVTVKKVIFYNNLVPTIQIYGKKYEHKMPITKMKELDDLLEKIDSIEKCYGRGGFVFEQCIGYFENSLHNMCNGCQELVKDRDLQRMQAKIDAKNNALESFKNRIAEKTAVVVELRRRMAEMKNLQRTLAL
ncbi:uncharacterized protein LOC132947226 [Metopolophium dirhodum]|uniref:uncharacterized protein LOC132947226 n=1 Tax=Metopolophium dirhodum TaxID=44670 RepID=UPI00298F68B9|nr:uncharacterized protein LOC132947226 [Metopolophium dirhodum]